MEAIQIQNTEDLDFQVWTIEDIAIHLKCSVSAARIHARKLDFPKPIGGERRNRKWYRDQVIDYFRNISTQHDAQVHQLHRAQFSANQVKLTPRRGANNA